MPEHVMPDHVLVVDDEPQIQRLLAVLMRGEGFTCEVAGSAADARARVQEAEPALVLLDVSLPDESGLSLARELAARPSRPAVIIVSGHDDTEVAGIALDLGAYGYVLKPFKRNELVIAAQNAMRRRRAERESAGQRARLEERVLERTAAVQDALLRLDGAHEETVLRLSKAIEYRDPETGLHIERMSHYCAVLARRLGLDPDLIRVASRLHDVGKIGVSDAILRKPGPLTPEERTEMQRHADIGHRLLRGSRSAVLECAATIAWTHHERWDGTGYPRALAGEDIPLAGRIACVADTFDALITDRVYSPAMPVHEALDVLVAERGGQFDPRVVDVFLEEVEAVHAIIARFEEEHAPAPDMVAQDAGRNGALITLREAAAGVGVSTSTLRRWADDGRIASVRTAGGHRRFPIEAVRKLAASRSAQPAVRPIAPPSDRLVALAGRLRAQGVDLAAVAAGWLYRGDGAGWFAGEAGVVAVREWLGALVRSCETGDYTPALEAGDLLMRRAYLQGATLLERHGFLERFADAAIGSLTQAGAPRADLASARRLLTVHQQRLLDSCG